MNDVHAVQGLECALHAIYETEQLLLGDDFLLFLHFLEMLLESFWHELVVQVDIDLVGVLSNFVFVQFHYIANGVTYIFALYLSSSLQLCPNLLR